MPPITVPLRVPELASGTWIQGPEVSIAFARGAVVLVDFWESTCINCLRTLPYLKAWHERYARRGLVVVGVHTPEFEVTADPAVVRAAVEAEGIPYPVLLDAGKATWERFANKFWPSTYLADARGYLRYEHVGEGAYGETEAWIQRLLREAGDAAPMPEPLAPLAAADAPGAVCYPATRELQLGWHRGKLLAAEGYRPGEEVRHAPRAAPAPPGMLAARGLWRHEAEYLEAREPGAELKIACDAAGVNLVVAGAGVEGEAAWELEVEVDGAPVAPAERGADLAERDGRTVAAWDRPRLLRLVDSGTFRRRLVTLRFPRPGSRAYAVSFGSCMVPC